MNDGGNTGPTITRPSELAQSTLTGTNNSDFTVTDYPRIPGHEIVGILGEGGPSIVYEARTEVGRSVALKMLKPLAGNRDGRDRFFQEAAAMARVKHANVVTLYHWDRGPDGWPYFTMPVYAGGSLAKQLRWYQESPQRAVEVMIKVASAVAHLHSQGMVHRDLKPHNVLLDENREPFVSDLGLVKWEPGKAGEVQAGVETQVGAIMGTIAYMSPEQARGEASDARSDVWSLGVMLFELLVWQRPFASKDPKVLLDQIRTQEPPTPQSLQPGLDTRLARVVEKCLQLDPTQRYATATEVADELRANSDSRSDHWTKRHRKLLTGLVAFAVLGLAAVLSLPGKMVEPRSKFLDSLRQRRATKLFDETGTPVSVQRITGPADGNPFHQHEGAFTINTQHELLTEVVPADICPDGFRFEVEVCPHRLDPHNGRTGIYFMHTELERQGWRHHAYSEWGFNAHCPNLADAGWRPDVVPGEMRLPRPGIRGWVSNLLSVPASGFPSRATDTLDSRLITTFLNVPPDREDWYRLAVELTPDYVEVYWQNAPLVRRSFEVINQTFPITTKMSKLAEPVTLRPNGGIGLFVYQGMVSFRSGVITPLNPLFSKPLTGD